VDGEADILQDRVEIVAFEGCGIKAAEGIGSEDGKARECSDQQALRGQHQRQQVLGQVAAEHRHGGAEPDKDQDPEQDRPLVVPPDACDLVDQRLQRVRIFIGQLQREIGSDEGLDQRSKRRRDQQELQNRCLPDVERGSAGAAPIRKADEGGNACDGESRDQREMAKLDGHHMAPACWAGRHSPRFFKSSTISFGM
jgi:hypothetical protein